jgi:hypothetical protein
MALTEIIDHFRSGDPERYGEALQQAEQIAAAPTLPDGAVAEVLAAVTTPFPEVGPQRAEEVLMVLLARHAREVPPADLAEAYPNLPETARAWALRVLAQAATEKSMPVLAQLLEDIPLLPEAWWPILGPLEYTSRDADAIIHALSDAISSSAFRRNAALTLIGYGKRGLLWSHAERLTELVLPHGRNALSELGSDLDASLTEEARRNLGMWSDLLASLATDDARAFLTQVAKNPDPAIAVWGVIGLERAGADMPDGVVALTAAYPASRIPLIAAFTELHGVDAIPDEYITQVAIAEGALALWLQDPNHLGTPPEAIEHLHTEEIQLPNNGGPGDVYVFRYRPKGAPDGTWLIGIAGPYARAQQPTLTDYGYTYSVFSAEDECAIDEHINRIAHTVNSLAIQR